MNIERAINKLDEQDAYPEWYCGCVEPGYTDQPVIAADWNKTNGKWLDALENNDISLEWCDEWAACQECQKAVRTQPDSYSWTPSYFIFNDCELFCKECILSDIDEYIAELVNNPDHADTFDVDWESHGFTRWNDDAYENGFHPGQNDEPPKIYATIKEKQPNSIILFSIDSVSQFDLSFSAWIRSNII